MVRSLSIGFLYMPKITITDDYSKKSISYEKALLFESIENKPLIDL